MRRGRIEEHRSLEHQAGGIELPQLPVTARATYESFWRKPASKVPKEATDLLAGLNYLTRWTASSFPFLSMVAREM